MKNADKCLTYIKGSSKLRTKENIKLKESFIFFILFFIINLIIHVNTKEYKMNNNKRKIDSDNYIHLKIEPKASSGNVNILGNASFSTSISDIYLNEEKEIITLKKEMMRWVIILLYM